MFARSLGIYRYAAAQGTTNLTWIGFSEKKENYFNNEFAINGMVERVVLFLLYARNFLTYVEKERGKGRDRDR